MSVFLKTDFIEKVQAPWTFFYRERSAHVYGLFAHEVNFGRIVK